MKYILSLLLLLNLKVYSQELSLNLNTGETYKQSYTSTITVNQNINGIDQKVVMEISGGMDFQVNDVTDEGYSMTAKYTRLVMKLDAGMGQMAFSSEENAQDLFSQIMKGMVNTPFSILMTKQGTISEIEDLNKLFENAFSAFPELPEIQKKQIIGQMEKAYGEKAFKGNIEMMTAIFPSNDVSVGDQWENEVKLESGMSAMMTSTYTLKERGDKVVIEGLSNIVTKDKEAYVEVDGMPTKYNLNGTMKSTYTLDPKTNWIKSGQITQDIGGSVEIKDNANLPGGMTIPMTMVTEMAVGN